MVLERAIKRLFDVLVAATALMFLSLMLVLIAILVRLQMGTPVVFRQARGGLGSRGFNFFKFRTMTDARDELGELLPDYLRITGFGRMLRASSLDELPQLWNVLMGDMSLIGPRPLLAEYISLYNTAQKRRHDVPPGITGWAQVNGRNALSWDEKFALDVWYVDHWSLRLDCLILWRTLGVALARQGVDQGSEITMPKFTGPFSDHTR